MILHEQYRAMQPFGQSDDVTRQLQPPYPTPLTLPRAHEPLVEIRRVFDSFHLDPDVVA